MGKKQIRDKFRNDVFKRDQFVCQVCKLKANENELNAHHITDRSEMPNGGYVKENGITVHEKDCHFLVEKFHIYEGEQWEEGLHPDDLYKIIKSSKELAIEKSKLL